MQGWLLSYQCAQVSAGHEAPVLRWGVPGAGVVRRCGWELSAAASACASLRAVLPGASPAAAGTACRHRTMNSVDINKTKQAIQPLKHSKDNGGMEHPITCCVKSNPHSTCKQLPEKHQHPPPGCQSTGRTAPPWPPGSRGSCGRASAPGTQPAPRPQAGPQQPCRGVGRENQGQAGSSWSSFTHSNQLTMPCLGCMLLQLMAGCELSSVDLLCTTQVPHGHVTRVYPCMAALAEAPHLSAPCRWRTALTTSLNMLLPRSSATVGRAAGSGWVSARANAASLGCSRVNSGTIQLLIARDNTSMSA
jgi:hypothetical protein